jgi:hypothetical protein
MRYQLSYPTIRKGVSTSILYEKHYWVGVGLKFKRRLFLRILRVLTQLIENILHVL